MRTRFFVFCDQPQQQPFLERTGEIEVTDLWLALLAIAIDASVALFQPVRIVRQIEMDQMAATAVAD